ncbi:hypothetical protein O3M35_007874 [Rhynocoris fuscipes]
MNFDIEESEMRIFSEDETNQLFSSGASIVFGALDTESNLEQRFSNQELRYIDSYSPDPMEGESPSEDILTPGYQPLLTPSSYENLRGNNNGVNNTCDESVASSRKSEDISPYAYEKLDESPNNVPDTLQQKKENDLYESCSVDVVINKENNIYESMETEQEPYENVITSTSINEKEDKTYENEEVIKVVKDQNLEQNIYEDVQLTPSEIYEQVSYLKSSVEEVNRMVSEPESKPPCQQNNTVEKAKELVLEKCDNSVFGGISPKNKQILAEGYEEITPLLIDTPEELKSSTTVAINDDNSKSSLEIVKESQEETKHDDNCSSSKQSLKSDNFPKESNNDSDNSVHNLDRVQMNECTNVPVVINNRGVNLNNDNIYDSVRDTEYENVSFVLNKNVNDIICKNENTMKEMNTSENDAIVMLSATKEPNSNEILCDSKFNETISTDCNKETTNITMANESPTNRQSETNDNNKVDHENKQPSSKLSCSVVSEVLKRDWVGRCKDASQMSLPLNKFDNDNDFGKTEKLRKMFEKDNVTVNLASRDVIPKLSPINRTESINQKDDTSTKFFTEESDIERRERIEKYKEERRMFFRNKYKTDNINNNDERDDELIRRIKQKTKLKEFRESDTQEVGTAYRRRSIVDSSDSLKSPTKTTVSISYSPTKIKTLDLEQLATDQEPQKKAPEDHQSSTEKNSQ